MEIRNLLHKEFKLTIIKMLSELRRTDEHSENFNKKIENIKKNQSEVKNTITEMKNILGGFNSRLDDAEEQISNLEDRIVEITQLEQKKKKGILKMRIG